MNNWKTLKEETPIECSICLITVNGNVALATYSEGEFIQYGNDEQHYNNVSAWQYTDAPFEDETSKYKKAINYLLNKFQSCREYIDEDEKFYLLGGWDNDRVFVIKPRSIEDIDCINTFTRTVNGKNALNYENIGETYVLIFGSDIYGVELEKYDYVTISKMSEVLANNTRRIMDIITRMDKEEIEAED